jgi:hypothetical protein
MAKGISVHAGLNAVDPGHYQGWDGVLRACEADATDMADIARSKGYSSTMFLTRQATRSAIISAIEQAANDLDQGDIFFLTYSGHGGQVPDVSGDEPDLQDETWCLYDGQLIDDELSELWAKFKKGVRVLVLSDSCHSGSVTRAIYDGLVASGAATQPVSSVEGHEAPVYRAMPDEAAFRTYRANRAFYDGIAKALPSTPSSIQASVRLISGCQDNQLSMDGLFNGKFTGTLMRVWNNGRFKQDYQRFHRAIVKRMPPTQTPNHFVIGLANPAYDAQTPFEI